MPNATSTRIRFLIAVAACAGLPGATPPAAHAGTYPAAICNPDLGVGRADAGFERSSRHYVSTVGCEVGGDGLTVAHEAKGTAAGRWGAWSIRAPGGTAFSRLSATAAGRRGGGHVPELLTGPLAGPLAPIAPPRRGLRRVHWSGAPAQVFSARLRCRRASGCGPGRTARLRIKRIVVTLDDRVPPALGITGSLLGTGSRRGLQIVEPFARDAGGGVRRLLLQVNGEPVTAHTVPCKLTEGVAVRLRPCPPKAQASFTAATSESPFRQGPNLVRVCAADYAPSTAANRTCVERSVRVDNLCPLSEVAGGARLRAHLHRGRRRATGVRRSATLAGRLLSGGGEGVANARICVATRVRTGAVAERVIATPTTGAEGRFAAKLPAGPSREVRVAYWRTPSTAVERYLDLDVAARPRLRLVPDHAIRNGNRVRFEVRLQGPRYAGRRVRIQVRAGRRWIELRQGHTGRRGTYRASYRFHATTGRRRYAFRALVPKQAGYPYEAGHSRVDRVTVLG